MIRGVSRQIIEVKNTDNALFERALLFVSPDADGDGRIKKEADRLLAQFSADGFLAARCLPTAAPQRGKLRGWLIFCVGALAGAGVGVGCMLVF